MRHGEGKQCTRGWNWKDDMRHGWGKMAFADGRVSRNWKDKTTSMDGGAKSIVEVPTFAHTSFLSQPPGANLEA